MQKQRSRCFTSELEMRLEKSISRRWGRAPFLVFTLDIIFLLYVAYKCCVKLGIGGEKRESQVQIMMTIVFDIAQRFLP